MSRKRSNNEIKTPQWVVKQMVDCLPPVDLESTYLEPACWHAPFAREILDRKLKLCKDYEDVLTAYKTVYGYELHADNLKEGRGNMMCGFEDDRNIRLIVNTNFVLRDAFTNRNPETGEEAEFYDWNKGEWFEI